MDVNAFTHKAQEALAGAERLALGSDHQRVQPEHLLTALLSDPEGIVFPLVRRAGADPGALKARAGEALGRIPKVYGPEQGGGLAADRSPDRAGAPRGLRP